NAPQSNILKSVEVINGGQLYINHPNDVGFNPSGITGTSNSHYQVKTANTCDTNRVKVSYGGMLTVGLSFAQNTGELIFEPGSVLEIDSGGKLVVEEGSTLIIREGAALEIHPNARIFLNGEHAKLVIEGKVVMHPNAELTYSSEVAEMGMLVFNQRHWNDHGPVPAGTNWSIGNNAKFVLKGAAQHIPTVICQLPLNAYDENRNRFSLIEFDDINLLIDSGMYANLTADSLVLVNSNITSLDNGRKHMGVQVWGKSLNDVVIKNNDFSDCYRCFKGYQLGVQQALLIDSCTFSNSDLALEFENGNFTLSNVSVNDGQIGLVSNRALGQSRILYSDFVDVHAPVKIESESSARLMISSSSFDISGNNPLDTAIYHHSVGLRMTCSSIDNFSVGVDCRSALIDLSEEAMNQINATLPILLTDATGVLLTNGENIFSVTPVYVSGSLHNSAIVPIINQKIDATNNAMPHNTSGIGHVQFNGLLYDLEVQTNHFTTMCTNNTNGFALPTVDGWIGGRSSGITVNLNDQSFPLELALDGSFALLYGQEESHIEESAMEVLDEVILILDQAVPQLTETSSLDAYQIAKVGFTMAYDLLRMAYMYNHLEVVHADPLAQPNSYVASMNNYISVFSGLLPNGSQYDNHRADLELLRAHLYRIGHYHALALSALNEVSGNLSQRNIDRRDYWQCVLGWEQQMLLGNISEDEFMEEFWNCNTLYSPYISYESDDPGSESTDGFFAANDIAFYPNPTNDFLYMRTDGIAKLDDELLFTVTSLEGRTVLSELQTASYVQRVNVDQLSSGVYIISLKTPYREYQRRFVKK
ncbi:MAG: T9SS type A sorting domain-containing protein, partial [Cryomorphaceae bacterium]|nr:T9SS type A sorting domain-containing protein [Cryomorphaceae bacterium]